MKHTPHFTKVPVAHLYHSPNNPRRKPTDNDPEVKSLADSIAAVGLLEPLLACKSGQFKYEIIAGARRFEAAKLAGMTDVPCMVYDDLDTDAMLDMTVSENLQRSDLTPLEEGRGIAMLLESGRSVAEVASNLARSEAWVRRRAKLAGLIPAWQKAVTEQALRYFSVGHLELVAQFTPAVQEQILDGFSLDENTNEISLSDFKAKVSRFLYYLAEAKFDTKECRVSCTKRSDMEPDLFKDVKGYVGNDLEDDCRCLDRDCWSKKTKQWEDKLAAKVRKETKMDPIRITNDYHTGEDGYIATWRAREVEQGTPGAVPAVHIDGEDAGKVVWIADPTAQARPAQREEARPEATLEQKRLHHMIVAFNAWLTERGDVCPPALVQPIYMLAAAAALGTNVYGLEINTPEQFDKLTETDDELMSLWWKKLAMDLEIELYSDEDASQIHVDEDQPRLLFHVHLCGMDIQDFIDQAERAFPDEAKPKAKKGGKK